MKTSSKLLIDRTIAVPFAWAANLAARAAAPIARRDHSINRDTIRTIAVQKLLGMGSIIQATPLLNDLRRAFPQAKIIFVTGRANRALIERLEMIDEAVYIDDSDPARLAASTAVAVGTLLRKRLDLYVDLEVYSAGASVLSVISGARNRAGFYRRSARFKRGLFTHLTVFNPRMPISSIYRQLNLAMGGTKIGEPTFGPIRVSSSDEGGLAEKRARAGMAGRYIVVNPNASDLLVERRWPRERYAELIEHLARRGDRIALTGAPHEVDYVKEVIDQLSPKAREHVWNTAGELGLGELFALIRNASCVVTNDTGPMHFSIALGCPTVCLFGPANPEHYGVRRANVDIIYHAVYCSPCVYELDEPACGGNNVCMQLITVPEVIDAIDRQLAGKASEPPRVSLPVLYEKEEVGALGVIVRASKPSVNDDAEPSLEARR
jgi:ADP-heptose:LPS heptosyltransferase